MTGLRRWAVDTTGHCTFCESSDTVWQHDLNSSLCSFRTMFGKGTVWADSHKLCDRCEQLYNAGEYAELARLQTTDPPSYVPPTSTNSPTI